MPCDPLATAPKEGGRSNQVMRATSSLGDFPLRRTAELPRGGSHALTCRGRPTSCKALRLEMRMVRNQAVADGAVCVRVRLGASEQQPLYRQRSRAPLEHSEQRTAR